MKTFDEYGLRFDIEENFLDDKSNGFQLEASLLRSPQVLTRLCLVLAVATLFLVCQVVEVQHLGKRRWVDPHWFRGNSCLRISWNWLKHAKTKGWNLLSCLVLDLGVNHRISQMRFNFANSNFIGNYDKDKYPENSSHPLARVLMYQKNLIYGVLMSPVNFLNMLCFFV